MWEEALTFYFAIVSADQVYLMKATLGFQGYISHEG
jgi:hypothetical protein